MLKLLIADDEKAIRDSISTLIDWNSLEIKLIGTAKNGIDAYNIILDQYPDIILTDIKMPGLTGLELIRKIHEIAPQTEFIILSGYGEFEFAKEAMQYGVQHYLLKPCTTEQIIDSVVKARDTHLNNLSKENKANELKQISSFYGSSLFANLINCYLSVAPDIQLSDKDIYPFYSDFRKYIGDMNVPYDAYYIYYAQIPQQKLLIESISRKIANLYPNIQLIFIEVQHTIIFFFETFAEKYPLIEDVLSVLCLQFGTEYQHIHFPSITVLAEKVTKQIRRYNTISITSHERSVELSNSSNILRNIFQITKNMYSADPELSQKSFNELKDTLSHGTDANYLHQFASAIITSSLSKTTVINAISGTKLLSELDKIKDLSILKQLILEQINKLYYSNQNENAQMNISDKIKEYVESHIEMSELSLKWIGEKVMFMNIDYLSRKFTTETGEHFSQYLTRIRIEKSKELLSEFPSYNISTIAEKVGCGNNPQYFSQIFKKYCGVTPKNYIKSLQKDSINIMDSL